DEGSVNVTFVEADGRKVSVKAPLGKSLLEVAHENDVELEGACGGDLACSTCHLVFPKDVYDTLPPKQEEEEDMLDLAWGLTDTSRLGCQIKVTPALEGALLKIPEDPYAPPPPIEP
ncbi:2Fe-2S ferredoxin-type domain-containing protein, partial [Tribonema minus]